MSIRVLKDALDPTELALVQEINDMGMPLTIQVDQSLADAGISCGQQQGGGRLGITPNSYGPGAYKQAQEAMGSPASDQFNIDDLLKYFTGTPTPKQAMQTSRFKPQQLHIPQSGASSLPPTPGTLLDPHRQLLHKLFHKGMQGATPRGSASQTSQKPPTGLNLQLVPQNQLSTLSGLGTPGIRAAAVDLGLDEVSEAVDVLLSPSFNDDDLSALLEALEGGDSGGGSFHTGFTPRGVMRTGLTPKAERQAKRSRIS